MRQRISTTSIAPPPTPPPPQEKTFRCIQIGRPLKLNTIFDKLELLNVGGTKHLCEKNEPTLDHFFWEVHSNACWLIAYCAHS